jgi:uncharacterized protein
MVWLPAACLAAGRADEGFEVEYFFYCRDRPGSMALRWELAEEHWSFMDRYADAMIARGPTLTADGSTATGSVHFVDLPDADAARVFAFEEPNYLAGVYDEVLVRRWRNMLGRTMWDFARDVAGDHRFLILGHGKPGMTATLDELRDEHRRYIAAGGFGDRLIACGPLLSDDGSGWAGTVMLAEFPGRATAEAILAGSPYARAGLYYSIEVHSWQFGGRSQV